MFEAAIMNLYLSSMFTDGPIIESLDVATVAPFCAAAASLSFLLATWKQIAPSLLKMERDKKVKNLQNNNF